MTRDIEMGRVEFVAATFPISRSSDIDIGRKDGSTALEWGGGGVVVF